MRSPTRMHFPVNHRTMVSRLVALAAFLLHSGRIVNLCLMVGREDLLLQSALTCGQNLWHLESGNLFSLNGDYVSGLALGFRWTESFGLIRGLIVRSLGLFVESDILGLIF